MINTVLLCIFLVLAVIYIVPVIVYAVFSSVAGVKQPKGSPVRFLLSIFISKLGTAIAFVLIYYVAGNVLREQLLLYAFLWWIFFILGEIGQAVGPDYTWKEAIAGMISETLYVPFSAYILHWLL